MKEANLSGSRLGQVGYDEDFLGSGEGSDDLADLKYKLLDKGSLVIRVIGEFTSTVFVE